LKSGNFDEPKDNCSKQQPGSISTKSANVFGQSAQEQEAPERRKEDIDALDLAVETSVIAQQIQH